MNEPIQNRWLNWRSSARITEESPDREPTKPSKPGSVGFVGPTSTPVPEIAVDCQKPEERVMSWCEWQAAALNRLFLEQGVTGQPGRITPETIRRIEQEQANDE